MYALTQLGLVTCDHATGVVTLQSSQSFVRVAGGLVLVGNNPSNQPIAGCSNLAPTIKPCTRTINVEDGKSSLVYIGGKPVCMDTIVGGTDGTPPSATKYRVRFAGQVFVDLAS